MKKKEKRKHKLYLVPKEKIIAGGPMNIFIRCKNKGCSVGIDWMSLEDPEILLEKTRKDIKSDCPYSIDFSKI